MIEIAPAILTTDPDKIGHRLELYFEADLLSVDIDIQDTDFASDPTATVDATVEAVSKVNFPDEFTLTWDLKVSDVAAAVKKINQLETKITDNSRVVIYDESAYDQLKQKDLQVGLGVLNNQKVPKDPSKYPFIQIMTIAEEKQGGQFSQPLLTKIFALEDAGFTGEIWLDGGVNLRSGEMIKEYGKMTQIHKVSVGSFFQNTATKEEVKLNYQKLQLALNL